MHSTLENGVKYLVMTIVHMIKIKEKEYFWSKSPHFIYATFDKTLLFP